MVIMKALLSNTKFNCILIFLLIFSTKFFPLQSNPSYITKSSDYYIVKKGDNITKISRKKHISIKKIRLFNNLKSDKIYLGQKIYLTPKRINENSYVTQREIPKNKFYIVKKHDTLYRISKMFGISVMDLVEFNNLASFDIKVNQKLLLTKKKNNDSEKLEQSNIKPKTTKPKTIKSKTKVNNKTKYYFVKKGDNLYRIAKRHSMSLDELKKLNNLKNNNISVGQKLTVSNYSSFKYKKNKSVSNDIPISENTKIGIPIMGKVISKFGLRNGRPHKGIDIAAPLGSPIKAVLDGKVVFSGIQRGYGNVIVLEHKNSIMTVYAHNESNLVRLGDQVKKGQPIATLGQSGNAYGPHLHFEYRIKGRAIDPLTVLKGLSD